MDNLINLLNHKSNFTIVANTTTKQRQVVATKPLTPGDIIGPSSGLPAEYVLNPVEILKCSDVAQKVLSIAGDKDDGNIHIEQQRIDKEKMAFWIALAVMGREAEQRQQQQSTESSKKRKHTDSSPDHTTKQTQQQVHDAYLLSLPKEGPDPCCWSKEERDILLKDTPLSTQINTTLTQINDEYNRVAKALTEGSIKLPPFSINGRGTFPSVLWARSMHISRSFPRSLIDEEGVWWQGRKRYQPPSETTDTEKAISGDSSATEPSDDSTTVLSVRLGGYRAPVITTSSKDQPKEEESKSPPQPSEEDNKLPSQPPQQPKESPAGSTLGILIPLMDMIDHKNAHPVQWESVYNSSTQTRSIRFRSCVNIKEGDELYNNYGPKGNLELLATYGFAISNNVLDSVEGIVLGISMPNSEDEQEMSIYQAQVELVKEYDMPHRIDKDKGDFGVLFLGPFLLHRKLSSSTDDSEENDKIGDESEEGGVIPDELYRALSIIGLENVEEGPMVSIDEMEILKEVLTKKLNGFGTSSSGESSSDTSTSVDQLMRTESVEAYTDGQRQLLQLALAELDSLMVDNDGGGGEDTTT